MKVLVTGLGGTVAPALAAALSAHGHLVLPWDRRVVPIEDASATRSFLQRERPDAFCHLATGSPEWAALAATECAAAGIPFLFTSSVSVYSPAQVGPFRVDAAPEPDDDYGRYKLECERRVVAAHPDARIVRLGWQIGTDTRGNQMLAFLDRTQRETGGIAAGARWYPACSFLDDTASALIELLLDHPAGLYHLDGNPGLSFLELVTGLNRLMGYNWTITPEPAPARNHLLVDPRVPVAQVTRRLSPERHA